MQLLNAPESTVLRDGTPKNIPSEELVRDDIVIFSAGNQICADAVLCEGTLRVNEALMTGEPDEIEKIPAIRFYPGALWYPGRGKRG